MPSSPSPSPVERPLPLCVLSKLSEAASRKREKVLARAWREGRRGRG